MPEGERLECLLRRLSKNGDTPIPIAHILSETADLPSGLEVRTSHTLGHSIAPTQYTPSPQLPALFDHNGKYCPVDVDVRLSAPWYNTGRRMREFQPNPSFCGVQDKFTATAEWDQDKIVLRPVRQGERGNVIVKPNRSDIPFMAETEFICMQSARACGLTAANCFLFESPVQGRRDICVMDLAILRFDREDDGSPRETADLAALLGLDPSRKYTFDRSSMLSHLLTILSKKELARLTEALFFGTLIGNGDMHLKNFSVLRRQGKEVWHLAPLYDMLSTEALRYEARLDIPVNQKAYAILTQEELRTGCASCERLLDIASRLEQFILRFASSVLMDSEYPGFFTPRSLAKRIGAVVRKNIKRALLGSFFQQSIEVKIKLEDSVQILF